jgi:hypothetical protein
MTLLDQLDAVYMAAKSKGEPRICGLCKALGTACEDHLHLALNDALPRLPSDWRRRMERIVELLGSAPPLRVELQSWSLTAFVLAYDEWAAECRAALAEV